MFCCTWAVGCQIFVQYIRMLCPGRFILVESVPWRTMLIHLTWNLFRNRLINHQRDLWRFNSINNPQLVVKQWENFESNIKSCLWNAAFKCSGKNAQISMKVVAKYLNRRRWRQLAWNYRVRKKIDDIFSQKIVRQL